MPLTQVPDGTLGLGSSSRTTVRFKELVETGEVEEQDASPLMERTMFSPPLLQVELADPEGQHLELNFLRCLLTMERSEAVEAAVVAVAHLLILSQERLQAAAVEAAAVVS